MIHVSRANKFFVNIPRSQFCESKPHLLPANKQGVEQAQQSGQKSLVTKLDDHKTELKHLGSVAFQIFMGLLTFPNGPGVHHSIIDSKYMLWSSSMDESSGESSFKEVAYTLLEQMDVSKVIFCSFELVCLSICRKGMQTYLSTCPKVPDPSKLASLRTKTPLLCRLKPLHIGGSNDP